jgi:ketosteroid isomerase-like protein
VRWKDHPGAARFLYASTTKETQVRRHGDTAVVVGRQNQKGSMGSNPLPFATVRATLVLLNQSGAWRLAGVHYSFIAGTPGAPPVPGQ